MSAPRSDQDLMRYLDGELSPKERTSVEEYLAASAEARQKLEALRQLGGVVEAFYTAEENAARPQLDSLWARLDEELDRAEAREAVPRPGLLSRLGSWLGARKGHLAAGLVGAAAGAALVLVLQDPQVQTKREIVYVDRPVPQAVAASAPMETAEVEDLEVTGGTGMILQFPGEGEDDPATTVIWVTPSEAEDPI